jgi:pimeloyl-ACP methyl ester carboxylesterase
MTMLRSILGVLQPTWPAGAAWLTERLFFTAPRRRTSPAARAFLAGGERFTLRVDGRRVVGWRWGNPDAPAVYLCHGWGSRGARLAAFSEPLLAAGYRVVTYDAPGHGASGWGMSSMPEFARTLAAVVARESRGTKPHAVIAHSFGCSGTALALSWGLEVNRLVFLAPAANPPAWVQPFVRALELQPQVIDRVRARSERRIRARWDELDVCDIASRLSHRPPLLIVHDKADDTVLWDDGAAIARVWRDAELVTTKGLGHRGVTHDRGVVGKVMGFVAGATESQQLEYDLYHREERV